MRPLSSKGGGCISGRDTKEKLFYSIGNFVFSSSSFGSWVILKTSEQLCLDIIYRPNSSWQKIRISLKVRKGCICRFCAMFIEQSTYISIIIWYLLYRLYLRRKLIVNFIRLDSDCFLRFGSRSGFGSISRSKKKVGSGFSCRSDPDPFLIRGTDSVLGQLNPDPRPCMTCKESIVSTLVQGAWREEGTVPWTADWVDTMVLILDGNSVLRTYEVK